jgi:hypothetical protein
VGMAINAGKQIGIRPAKIKTVPVHFITPGKGTPCGRVTTCQPANRTYRFAMIVLPSKQGM